MPIDSFLYGFELFFTPLSIGLIFLGIIIGLIVGALPGLGPLMGIILLLPAAISLPPIPAMGFLISIFVGGSCGGSISAILLRIPGTPLAAGRSSDKSQKPRDGAGSSFACSRCSARAGLCDRAQQNEESG